MVEALSGRKFASLVEDNKTAAEADINTAHGNVIAGIYTSSDPTLANNDFGFLRLTSDGKLMVDTELTIDGGSLHIDNMFVYSTDNTAANARYGDIDGNGYVSVNVMSMSGVVTDDSAQAATPQMINVGGEYRSGAPTTYTDGDATIFQTNMNGYLKIDGAGSQNQAVGASSIMQGAEAKAFNDSALPNTVSTGNAIRVAATLSGVQYFFPVTEDGAETPITNEDEAMKNNQAGYTVHGQVADFDGSDALPTTGDTEGKASSFAVTSQGVQFVTLVNDDGSDYGQIKGYDSGTDSLKGFEVSPLSSHHVEETLADVTNETNATTSYYMDMDGYKTFAVQIEINGGATDTTTVTVEASIQDDGTAAASATYQDVTNEWFEAANFTEDTILERNVPVDVKFVKIKTVTAGGNNDADYALYSKKSY
jgi:hypothetical protein